MVIFSCAPGKLVVSDELKASHDEYSVKGTQGILIKQKLSFGAFKTTTVKRSWTRGGSSRTGLGWGGPTPEDWVNIISMEYINKRQTLNFSMTDGRHESDVYCVSRFNAKDLHLGRRENSILNIALDLSGGGGSSESTYYVQVFTKNGAPWQLLLDNQAAQAKAKSYVGYLAKSDTEYYTIHPLTRLEHNGRNGHIPFGAAGFEIRNTTGKAVAAVSMIDQGVVFLGKTADEERFLMANVCAALLLQQQIG